MPSGGLREGFNMAILAMWGFNSGINFPLVGAGGIAPRRTHRKASRESMRGAFSLGAGGADLQMIIGLGRGPMVAGSG